MKWWQMVWLAALGIWATVIFFGASYDLLQGQTNLGRIIEFCLTAFTLPAIVSYLLLWALTSAAGAGRRRLAVWWRLRTARAWPARNATAK